MNHTGNMLPDSFSYIQQRAKPRIVLLDAAMRVALAEPEAVGTLLALGLAIQDEATAQLAGSLAAEITVALDASDSDEVFLGPYKQTVLRIRRLRGALGVFTIVFVDRGSRREELRIATKRFSLTLREVDVLRLILEGMSAADIGKALHITEGTVTDYFKTLLRKTEAKNRSAMLARVLNYTPVKKKLGVDFE